MRIFLRTAALIGAGLLNLSLGAAAGAEAITRPTSDLSRVVFAPRQDRKSVV